MPIQYKYFYLLPFIVNAWLTTKNVSDANLSLAYLNGIAWILDTRPTGWNFEKKIASNLLSFAYLYTIDIFSSSLCLNLEQRQYIHALSRLSIILNFGLTYIFNKNVVSYITTMTYMTFTLYLLVTQPCELYYASLGGLSLLSTSVLYLANSPGQHVGFATYLYCISKSLAM